MEQKTKYCVVKYDNLSLEADPERPGRSRSYSDGNVAAPQAFEKQYDDPEECKVEVARLNESAAKGEQVDITLANGSRYTGPRYTYVIGEVTR